MSEVWIEPNDIHRALQDVLYNEFNSEDLDKVTRFVLGVAITGEDYDSGKFKIERCMSYGGAIKELNRLPETKLGVADHADIVEAFRNSLLGIGSPPDWLYDAVDDCIYHKTEEEVFKLMEEEGIQW
jgi:hypothetical protein